MAGRFCPGALVAEALHLIDEDKQLCNAIAQAGSALVKPGSRLLTHCNTGGLATAGVGTALGVIARAHQEGHVSNVWVDETRPLLQGGRLTAWELELGVPYQLITDSMAASLMAKRAGWMPCGSGQTALPRTGMWRTKSGHILWRYWRNSTAFRFMWQPHKPRLIQTARTAMRSPLNNVPPAK